MTLHLLQSKMSDWIPEPEFESPSPLPTYSTTFSSLSHLHNSNIVCWNCNGMNSKLDLITHYLTTHKPLLLILLETRPIHLLSQLSLLSPTLSELCHVPSYTFHHAPHPNIDAYQSSSAIPFSSLSAQDHLPPSTSTHDHDVEEMKYNTPPSSPPSLTPSHTLPIHSGGGICYFIRHDATYAYDTSSTLAYSSPPSSGDSSQIHFLHLTSPIQLMIGTCYFSPSISHHRLSQCNEMLQRFLSHCGSGIVTSPFLLIGDMNAHHSSWCAANSSTPTNETGLVINRLLNHDTSTSTPLNLILLNSIHAHRVTTFHRPHAVPSVLDLAITTTTNKLIEQLVVDVSCPLISDHHPLLIVLTPKHKVGRANPSPSIPTAAISISSPDADPDDAPIRHIRFRHMKTPTHLSSPEYVSSFKSKWKQFQPYLAVLLTTEWLTSYSSPSSLASINALDQAAVQLINTIIHASTDVFGLKRASSCHSNPKSSWYYHPLVQSNIKRCHRAYRWYQSSNTAESKLKYQEAKLAMQSTIESTKKRIIEERIKNLHTNKRINWSVWNRGKSAPADNAINNIADINGNTPSSITQSLDNLCAHYARVSNVTSTSSCPSITRDVTALLSNLTSPLPSSCDTLSFTSDDIKSACASLSPSSAGGPDSIHPLLIKRGGKVLRQCILLLFNAIISFGYVPHILKQAWIISIFKKGERSDPNNYRPISLTSIIARMLERLIKPKLLAAIGPHLNPTQFGFRHHRSVHHNIFHILHIIITTMSRSSSSTGPKRIAAAFLDIVKAFDRVDHDRLLFKLHHMGVRGKLFHFIRAFLASRSASTTTHNHSHFSSPFVFLSGVPQGSVLGPILFLVYINDLLEQISKDTICIPLAFADDLAIIPNAQLADDFDGRFNTHLQLALDICSVWAFKWKMEFSLPKSNVVMFSHTNKYNTESFPTFTLNRQILRYAPSYRYVGLTLSFNLKWDDHAANTIQKCNLVNHIIGRFINDSSDFMVISKLVNVALKPIISFALPFWFPTAAIYKKLNSSLIHTYQCLLGCPPSTHIISLFHEAGQLPVQRLRDYLALTTSLNMVTSNSAPTMFKQIFTAIVKNNDCEFQYLYDFFKRSTRTAHIVSLPILLQFALVDWFGPSMAQSIANELFSNHANVPTITQLQKFLKVVSDAIPKQIDSFLINNSSDSTNYVKQRCSLLPTSSFSTISSSSILIKSLKKKKSHLNLSKSILHTAPYLLFDSPLHLKLRARLRLNRANFNDRKCENNVLFSNLCHLCDLNVPQTSSHIINTCTKFSSHRKKLQHLLELSPFRFKSDFVRLHFYHLCLGELPARINRSPFTIKHLFYVTSSFLSHIFCICPF